MTAACRICGALLSSSVRTASQPESFQAYRDLCQAAVFHMATSHSQMDSRFKLYTSILVDYLASLLLVPPGGGLHEMGFPEMREILRKQLAEAVLFAELGPIIVLPAPRSIV